MEPSHVLVRVDVERFVANARRDGESMTLDQARFYLIAWGLNPVGVNVWRCHRAVLKYFRSDEIEVIPL